MILLLSLKYIILLKPHSHNKTVIFTVYQQENSNTKINTMLFIKYPKFRVRQVLPILIMPLKQFIHASFVVSEREKIPFLLILSFWKSLDIKILILKRLYSRNKTVIITLYHRWKSNKNKKKQCCSKNIQHSGCGRCWQVLAVAGMCWQVLVGAGRC